MNLNLYLTRELKSGTNDVIPILIHNDIHHIIIKANPTILHCSFFTPNVEIIFEAIIFIIGALRNVIDLKFFFIISIILFII